MQMHGMHVPCNQWIMFNVLRLLTIDCFFPLIDILGVISKATNTD